MLDKRLIMKVGIDSTFFWVELEMISLLIEEIDQEIFELIGDIYDMEELHQSFDPEKLEDVKLIQKDIDEANKEVDSLVSETERLEERLQSIVFAKKIIDNNNIRQLKTTDLYFNTFIENYLK